MSLRFWRNQLRSGSHGSFLLLARGPGSFLADVLAALRRPREDGSAAPVAASDRIEERVRVSVQYAASMQCRQLQQEAQLERTPQGQPCCAGSLCGPQRCCCRCCNVQVVALQLLSTQLAEGLAAVHNAAGKGGHAMHAVMQLRCC